jgi:vacuolar-type H+-ATPase subunit H
MAEDKDKDAQEPENNPDLTAGELAGLEPANDPTKKKKSDDVERDRVTNQPLTDFVPTGDKKHAETVDVVSRGVRDARGTARHTIAARAAAAQDAQEERLELAEQQLDETKSIIDRERKELSEISVIPPDMYYAQENAKVRRQAAALGTKEIRPGGEFIVNGRKVDAFGEPL